MRKTAILVLALSALWEDRAHGATYQVGPGRTYTSLQQVVGLLDPGDVVEVDGNVTYPGGVTFTRAGSAAQPITIRGMRVDGNRPVLSGGTNTVAFVTPWPYSGPGADHYVFEGFEVTGGSSRCLYHQAHALVVRDVVVRDCPAQGILGADEGSGSLLLEHSEVYRCGNGTFQHQIYMATDEVNRPGSVFRMQHCLVRDGNGGNNVKSRAERNEIYYNWIEGALYHELELIGPDGGDGGDPGLAREDSDVVGNVFVKRNDFFVTRVGGDGTGETNGRYRFVNNTFVCGSAAAFRVFDGIESLEMHNNVFHRDAGTVTVVRTLEAGWVAGEEIAGSRNWVPTGAAGVPAQWTGTVSGSSPGFTDPAADDLGPAEGSPLLDQGTAAPAGPPGYPFPNPLFPPASHPPRRAFVPPGTAEPRPVSGDLDLGAFERSEPEEIGIAVDARNTTGLADGSASYPYPTIGAAVAAAAAGETIRVARGRYAETVWANGKPVRLVGGFVGATSYGSGPGDFSSRDLDPSLTWIEGTGADPTVRLTDAPGSVVDGFRITQGRHGILVDAFAWPSIVADVTITGCLVESNGAVDVNGGGINAVGSGLVLRGNTIRNNVGSSFAGVYLHDCSDALMEANLVEGNVGHGDHGGGVSINGWGTLRDNVIRDNRIGETVGYGWGGGVIVIEEHEHPTRMQGNVISGNFAPSAGGGVFVDEGAAATLEGELIVGNTALAAGGGVYVDRAWDGRRSQVTIAGCTVADNSSEVWPGWGAGLYVEASDVVVRDSIFWNNAALGGWDDFAVVDGGTLSATYTLSLEGFAGIGNLSADPLFANAAGNDYHLRSRAGRWDPGTAGWVLDEAHSPAIDAGDWGAEFALETAPNGGRRNLGAYGNTVEASRSWLESAFTLAVAREGSGAGTVNSSPPGIDCGSTCSAGFADGTVVTLTAVPDSGSSFAGWSGGGCSGTGTCAVTMSSAQAVTATFTLAPVLPQITSFTATPAVRSSAGASTLAWSTTGATSVTISGLGGTFALSGTRDVSVATTTTYTLTATNAAGSVTALATVNVLPPAGVGLSPPVITAPSAGQTVNVSGVGFNWNAVSSAAGYDVRLYSSTSGATVFAGSLVGSGSTSTLVTLPDGAYVFAVRACNASGFSDATCGAHATRSFSVSQTAPTGAPTVTAPAQDAVLTASTQTFSWTAVAKADPGLSLSYEVLLTDVAGGNIPDLQITVPDPTLSTIYTLHSSTLYELKVRACQAGCGPWSAPVTFSVDLPNVPTTAPTVPACSVSGGNSLTCNWTAIPGADVYSFYVVQPSGGPGGGALTVAARLVSTTTVTLPVPQGFANVIVAACTGDGCGPYSGARGIDPSGPNPSVPNLGTPLAASVVNGPGVEFSWNRIPGDDGTNTWYRLYVQDLSRQAAALDVYTRDNFYAAYFKAEGARYDALVVANPGPSQIVGPPIGFNVRGLSASAPTMVSPPHQSQVQAGNLQLGWSPVPGATLYQYWVAVLGQGTPAVTGVTPGLVVQVPLPAVAGQPTTYSGITRACMSPTGCSPTSDTGWGPWSNAPGGPGVTNFTVTP
jgi:hypothetical protein